MTDAALPARPISATDAASRARLAARYRAEFRFRLYGMIAIAITALFLLIVLADILTKGLPAFSMHQLRLDIPVTLSELSPQDQKNPVALRGADYQALVRDRLRALFPDVKDRLGRRALDGLLSSGAADVLRERVVADPSLVGRTVTVPVLVSADADLFLKGWATKIERANGQGTATPTATSGEVTVTSTAGDFAAQLAAIKRWLGERAAEQRREVARFNASLANVQGRRTALERDLAAARAANQPGTIASLEGELRQVTADVESLSATVKSISETAAAFEARAKDPASAEQLAENLPSLLVAINGGVIKAREVAAGRIAGETVIPLTAATPAGPGAWQVVQYLTPEANRRVADRPVTWIEALRAKGLVENAFNWRFFTSGDSREAELAGIRGALVGSALTLFVTLVICLPLGVAAAIYLEEFAPKNRLTEIVEVNINNLAAVPSIVFGLLGLAVFLNFFGLPRSAPLVGGLVLALLVLPTIIIAARAALKAVPPSIKEAALGVGASHQQAVFHHVLPLAMPGVLTGTIIGMAHALGETAPLLMIGMVAFIVQPATGVTDAATVLPVQIYLWSDLPEIGFQAKTAGAIIVLLMFLFVMNGAAIFLRKRFERRW